MDVFDVYEIYGQDPKFDHMREAGSKLVQGRGNRKDPVAMVIGEAPGAQEDLVGKPFIGASGQLLDGLLSLSSLTQDEIWITNTVKYRPVDGGRNRTPYNFEIKNSSKYLRQEWLAVGRPPLMITCGAVPLKAVLRTMSLSVSRYIGEPLRLRDNLVLVAMFHPAFPLRQRSLIPTVERHWEELTEQVVTARKIKSGEVSQWPKEGFIAAE
jgi:DNA polymerase